MIINKENSKTNLWKAIYWSHFAIHCMKQTTLF